MPRMSCAVEHAMNVFSLVLNSVEHDSRVQKTAQSLSRYGMVTVLGLRHSGSQPISEAKGDYSIRRICTYKRSRIPGIVKRLRQAYSLLHYWYSATLIARKGQLVVCNDVWTLPVGLMVKLLKPRVKIVYDSHEYQTQTHWVGPLQCLLIMTMERVALRFVSATIVVSPSIARAYKEDYGIAQPVVVMNCPVLSSNARSGRLREQIAAGPDNFIFLYQGGLTPQRGIEQIITAFRSITDQRLRLVFLGQGPLEADIRVHAAHDCRVVLLKPVPPSELLMYTADADFGLCLLSHSCLNHYYSLPNKLFEYLMAGVPVIASDLLEVRSVLERFHAGIIANDLSTSSLAKALSDATSFNRTRFVQELAQLRMNLCWETQEEVWKGVLTQLGFTANA